MARFFADLRYVLGPTALKRLVRRLVENNTVPLAGQLAYFFILFLFPFLIFMVSLVGLLIRDPEPVLIDLATRAEGLLPREVIELIRNHLGGALQSVPSPAFIGSILFTLGVGSAAAEAITNAANRAYGVPETRPFWKVRGVAILLILGFTALMALLVLALLSPWMGVYVRGGLGLPDVSGDLWTIVRWVLTFLTAMVALDVLYYLAPNAEVPFKWITPGGLVAAVLLLIANQLLAFFLTGVFDYNQLYGPLGASIVLLLWLYVAGLAMLVGLEMNAVLVHMAEERRGAEIVQPPKEDSGGR